MSSRHCPPGCEAFWRPSFLFATLHRRNLVIVLATVKLDGIADQPKLFLWYVQATSGVGFVFVEFADATASVKAQKALHGRMFGENQIDASYYSEDAMAQKQYI